MRLFIAVPLPAEIQDRAAACLPPGLPGVRVVRPTLLHLTLAFLGDVPDELLPATGAAAAEAAAACPAFPLVLDRAGRFPHRGRPAALWLGVGAGAEPLALLAAAVRTAVARRGLVADARPFQPHVTLARVHRAAGAEDRRAILAALAALRVPALPLVVGRIAVVESVLSPRGPTYTERASAALAAPAGSG